MKTFLTISFILICQAFVAQQGKVVDASSQQPIPYAQLFVHQFSVGTAADSAGTFELKGQFPEVFEVRVSAVGYETRFVKVNRGENRLVIELEPGHIELEEVSVKSSFHHTAKNSIVSITAKSAKELQVVQPDNIGELLANIPGVNNLSTGNGISKPVIRGLSGIRVVTYLNNLRIENQQWGGDHGIGVSDLGIGTVEVIKGPASLLYGADALGGVVYLSDDPFADVNTYQVGYSGAFSSNAMKFSNALNAKVSGKSSRLAIWGKQTNAADYQLPNKNFLLDSRYKGEQIKFGYSYNKGKWLSSLKYYLSNARVGLPGDSEDSIHSLSSFTSPIQSRKGHLPAQKILNSFLLWENQFFFKRSSFRINYGNSFNRLEEYEEEFSSPEISMNLTSHTYQLRYQYQLSEDAEFITGGQGMIQQNRNLPSTEELLIPNVLMLDNGVYGVGRYTGENWGWQAGIRYDQRRIQSYVTKEIADVFQGKYEGVNYSAGTYYRNNNSKIRGNISSGFRAPHIGELLAEGVHHGSLRYEMGNQNLKGEKGNQVDLSYEYTGEHISFLVNPFYNVISNYTFIAPIDSMIEGFPVYAYQQADEVVLTGGEAGMHYHPHFLHALHLESTIAYVRGTDNSGNSLALMPPMNVNSVVRYNINVEKKWGIKELTLQHQYYFAQNRIAPEEIPSKGYNLLNLGMTGTIAKTLEWKAGVKNLLNESYISHLSRLKNLEIPAPGINFYFGLSYCLQGKLKSSQQ